MNRSMDAAQEPKEARMERLWLNYYNDTLYARGVISENHRNKMRVMIKNRQ